MPVAHRWMLRAHAYGRPRLVRGRSFARVGFGLVILMIAGTSTWAGPPLSRTSPAPQRLPAECDDGPPNISGEALLRELQRGQVRRADELRELRKLKHEIEALKAALQAEVVRLEGAVAAAAEAEAQAEAAEKARETKRTEQAKAKSKAQAAALEPEDPIAAKKRRAAQAAERQKLAKALKAMTPKEAAKLLKALHPRLAADLLAKMRPASVGPVLAALGPKHAARLTSLVAGPSPSKRKARRSAKQRDDGASGVD